MRSARALLLRILPLIHVIALLTAAACSGGVKLPVGGGALDPDADDASIAAQPVCIGSTVRSAGRIGDTLFYRRARLPDGRLAVGYYVFYSQERPWGNNWLTWSLLPALAVDLVYTRGFFVGPGLQRAAYGKGDVEGFRVIYGVGPDGRLAAEEAIADDSRHRAVRLGPGDLFGIDPLRPTVYTRSWSHQLGARGAKEGDLVSRRCYDGAAIRPLTHEVARDFHLERRALPAAVGVIGPPARLVAEVDPAIEGTGRAGEGSSQ